MCILLYVVKGPGDLLIYKLLTFIIKTLNKLLNGSISFNLYIKRPTYEAYIFAQNILNIKNSNIS